MRRRGRRVAAAAGAAALVVLAIAAWRGWPQIRFRWLFEPLGRNAQGYLEYRHRKTGIVVVALPGGTFLMGTQKTDPMGPNYDPEAQDDEGPVHEVMPIPFMIAKCEVTQAQWKAVMRSNPSLFHGHGEDNPVERVSWEDTRGFLAKTGLRLPTEAEWECACRGGSAGPIAGTGKIDDMGWYGVNSGGAHPVGNKAANGFGLHDTSGNVWEGCEDVYDAGFYGKPEASGPDPISKSGSVFRVIRGGSWSDGASDCRSSCRHTLGPGSHGGDGDLGFRPVWSSP